MPPAEEFQSIRDDLFFWQAYDRSVKSDLSCCARRFGSRLIFIDPIPLAEPALEELLAIASPAAIIITSGNHARAADTFRKRFSIPILAHTSAATDSGLIIDQPLEDGAKAAEELTVIEIPGAAHGEIALHAGDVAHVGDALIHVESFGFALLPDKYCADPAVMRRSLGKLLRFDFELLTFAHGLPLVAHARRQLEHLLA